MNKLEAERLLLSATRQSDLASAVDYIAEGLFVDERFPRPALLHALCEALEAGTPSALAAIRRVSRESAQSDLNTAAVLLKPDWVTPPSAYRRALDVLADKAPTGSLQEGLSYRVVVAAQREDPNVVSTLAAIAGLSWSELVERAGLSSPSSPLGPWTPDAIRTAFEVIEEVVLAQTPAALAGSFPSRPIELLGDPDVTLGGRSGWHVIDAFRTDGVPYEVLLAQRTEGGSWRTHRDRIGRKYAHVLADQLCRLLDEEGVPHLRTRNCGGDVTRGQVNELVGGGGDQVAIVVTEPESRARAAVAISVANDGGSAAKSGARLAKLPGKVNVPVTVLVAGLGWASRNETAELATAVEGRLYSDRTMSLLARTLSHSTVEGSKVT